MTTATITADDIIRRHAAAIAYVAEEKPATTVTDFTYQLEVAVENFEGAGINGGDELRAGAQYLADADNSTDETERAVLLKRATDYLIRASDMRDEYRDMVGDDED